MLLQFAIFRFLLDVVETVLSIIKTPYFNISMCKYDARIGLVSWWLTALSAKTGHRP